MQKRGFPKNSVQNKKKVAVVLLASKKCSPTLIKAFFNKGKNIKQLSKHKKQRSKNYQRQKFHFEKLLKKQNKQ